MTDKADDLEQRARRLRARAVQQRAAGRHAAVDNDIRMAEELEFQAQRHREGRLK